MKRMIARLMLISIVLATWSGLPAAYAQRASPPAAVPGTGYGLTWHAIAGGAAFSAGGALSLGSTIGQAEPGSLSDGSYSIQGGFWSGAGSVQYNTYLPLARK